MSEEDKERTLVIETETPNLVESLLKAVAQAPQSLLMLDYDGTLSPFRRQRDQAFPYPGVTALVESIMRDSPTRVVIISGRDTAEVIPLLGIYPCPEMWGLHGLQRRNPDGTLATVAVEGWVLDALGDAERWLHYQGLEHLAEFKTGSIAVHWRGLTESAMVETRGRVLLGWKPIAKQTHLELLDFECGIEIRAPKLNKGDAVRMLLAEVGSKMPIAYLGDDATDEYAFRAIRGHGLGILVRPRLRQTAAEAWLRPPDELIAFLRRWLEATCKRTNREGEWVAAGN